MTRLVLGTAQLGMHYGVTNRIGPPSSDAAIALLRRAEAAGVGALDTAPGYGNAEELVARSGVELPVFTKLDPALDPSDSARRSLERLGRDQLDVVFLHQPDLMEDDPDDVIGRADRLVGELFVSLGASTYTTSQFAAAIADDRITTIQAPVSVADQRLVHSGLLEEAAAAGKRVVARSVYLQGALLSDPGSLPDHLRALESITRDLARTSADRSTGIAEALFCFVRDLQGVSDVLVGCETEQQLDEAVRAFGSPPLDGDTQSALHRLAIDDDDVIDPRRWPPQ